MKLIGLTLARNEAWVIEANLRVSLLWCDEVVVVDDSSSDGTHEIIAKLQHEYKKRLKPYYWNHGEHWMEMDTRQYSLDMGRANGGTHFAIIDADEMLTANHLTGVYRWFNQLQPGQCVDVPMIAPWKSLAQYSVETRGVITLGFMDAPNLCWKPRGEEKYQHHARPPHGALLNRLSPVADGDGGCFHLQWAAWDRMIWKHRHYEITELLRWGYPASDVNTKYHWFEMPPHGMVLKDVPLEWYGRYPMRLVKLDHEPWYKSECERLLSEHGKNRFKDLDLWGWGK